MMGRQPTIARTVNATTSYEDVVGMDPTVDSQPPSGGSCAVCHATKMEGNEEGSLFRDSVGQLRIN